MHQKAHRANVSPMTLLTISDLRPVGDGFIYLLSRAPEGAEGPALTAGLHEHREAIDDALQPPAEMTYAAGASSIAVKGLTEANREQIEAALVAALLDAHMATAGVSNEQKAEAAIRESMGRLPDLP